MAILMTYDDSQVTQVLTGVIGCGRLLSDREKRLTAIRQLHDPLHRRMHRLHLMVCNERLTSIITYSTRTLSFVTRVEARSPPCYYVLLPLVFASFGHIPRKTFRNPQRIMYTLSVSHHFSHNLPENLQIQ